MKKTSKNNSSNLNRLYDTKWVSKQTSRQRMRSFSWGSQKVTVDWTTTGFLIGQLVFFFKSQDISLTLQFARLSIEDLQLHREAGWFITWETLVISLINKSTPEIWWRHRSMQSTLFPSIMLVLPQSEVRANGGVYLKPPTHTHTHAQSL